MAIIGESRSGKTTRIAELIRECVARGERVGAIKHTHHPLNEEYRGDTRVFREAGAEPVMLAGEGEAVLFRGGVTSRITFHRPVELLRHFDTDVVFVEGFKNAGDWPHYTVEEAKILRP
ncbi:MAG TPA: molybdopterin-guanine dinucleotide biosynthesis protein MobB [Thermoanaerobaculia bacterium]|nr:molybdopterin-guanine dinucleotide biosynthesis protein MobB [Thermoanaerobaculia bacterium]